MTVQSELGESLEVVSFLPQHTVFSERGSDLPKVAQQVGGRARTHSRDSPRVLAPLYQQLLSRLPALSPSPPSMAVLTCSWLFWILCSLCPERPPEMLAGPECQSQPGAKHGRVLP